MKLNPEEIISKLSIAQKKAVTHGEGPALVLAGPGSGKTTVLIARTILLASQLQNSSKILCLTFSNAAANEMKNRYAQKTTGQEILPVFQTVHSFCNGVIKDYEKVNRVKYLRMEQEQCYSLLYKINLEINNKKLTNDELTRLLGWISRIKNRRDSNLTINFEAQIRNFSRIYDAYALYKEKYNMIDFDDMIFMARKILRNDDYIRSENIKKFDYIQVDEGQDLSKSQFDVINIIGAAKQNIFVVADDDQSIYGFRGADPSCVLDFGTTYPNSKIYLLEENYRSVASIVKLSSEIIKSNTIRYEKNLFTKNNTQSKINFLHFTSGYNQARFICDEIRRTPLKDSVGVLFRNNISALTVMAVMYKQNIKFNIAYEKINLRNNWIINEFFEMYKTKENEAKFLVPNSLRIFNMIIDEGFGVKCKEYCEISGQELRYINCIFEFLLTVCRLCPTYTSCQKLIDDIDGSGKMDNSQGNIWLSTIHSAKGLEYNRVFVIDLMKNEFPGSGAVSGSLLEEERRLFYVAITRAKNELFLLYPEKRGNIEEEAGIFYREAKKYFYVLAKIK